MALHHVQKTYEDFGRLDPMYAVYTIPEKSGNRWDADEFFATGQEDIERAFTHLAALGLNPEPGRALDFGCGAGRLTQALAERFQQVVGVDISDSMLAFAHQHNRHGERCEFVLNTAPDLSILETASFDFVMSYVTLQHNPPEVGKRYIAEFLRVLKPGGIALFHVPSGRRYRPGSLASLFHRFRSGPLKRAWKRLRGKPPVEMHHIHLTDVQQVISDHGGELVDILPIGDQNRSRVGMFYTVIRAESGTE